MTCLNKKVNKIHERTLRIVYKDTHADYEALLKLYNAVFVHQCNLQYLTTEIYKVKNRLNPSFKRELFKPRDLQHNLGKENQKSTTPHGIETLLACYNFLVKNCD